MSDLTRKERNCVRRMRGLLDSYEKAPASRHLYVVEMRNVLNALDEANSAAYAERLETGRERLARTMEGLKAMGTPSREELRDFEDAHAQGLHDDLPRDWCPECERQRGRVGP
jgi:hypothetical protein